MRPAYPFHKYHTRPLGALTGLWVASLIFPLILFIWGPPYLPLWLSLVEPAERLAPKIFIGVIPAISTALYILTLIFSRRSSLEHEEYLATLSLYSGNLLLALLLLATLRIMKVIL